MPGDGGLGLSFQGASQASETERKTQRSGSGLGSGSSSRFAGGPGSPQSRPTCHENRTIVRGPSQCKDPSQKGRGQGLEPCEVAIRAPEAERQAHLSSAAPACSCASGAVAAACKTGQKMVFRLRKQGHPREAEASPARLCSAPRRQVLRAAAWPHAQAAAAGGSPPPQKQTKKHARDARQKELQPPSVLCDRAGCAAGGLGCSRNHSASLAVSTLWQNITNSAIRDHSSSFLAQGLSRCTPVGGLPTGMVRCGSGGSLAPHSMTQHSSSLSSRPPQWESALPTTRAPQAEAARRRSAVAADQSLSLNL